MRIDPDLLPHGVALRTDVAIVGSGPAGLTIAGELAAAGTHVMLLEGGKEDQRRRPTRTLDGRSLGVPFPLTTSRQRGFGGTSRLWRLRTGLRTRPLDDIDFLPLAARPGTAWPLDAADMAAYYRRAAELVGIRADHDASAWFPPGPSPALAWPGGPQLAMFQFADHDVFLRQWDDVVVSRRIELLLGATVTRIDVAAHEGTVTRLQVRSGSGRPFTVEARAFVLACGAIENARLLLDSPGRTGTGVGNESDNVGRYFMDHISVDSGVVVPRSGTTIDVAAFGESCGPGGVKYQPMLWLGPDRVREHGLLNAAFWVNELDLSYLSDGVDAARSLRDGLRVTPRLPNAAGHLRRTVRGGGDVLRYAAARHGRRTRTHGIVLRALGEQVPDPASRIRLDDRTDPSGRRRVALDWRVGEDDLHNVRRHQDLLAGELERRGIGTVVERLDLDRDPPLVMSNHHHLGGTRMHPDPARGVVDRSCRVHTTPNLFVAGSSVFPTGGYVNPTFTLLALALRIGDAVREDLRPLTAAVPNG